MTDEVAVWEADYGEDVASVFSVPSPRDEPETAAEPEMPAAKAQPRRPAAAYAGQHPARDHAERPLTANERRALRQASNQMINFRYWTKSKAGCLFPPPHLLSLGVSYIFPQNLDECLNPVAPLLARPPPTPRGKSSSSTPLRDSRARCASSRSGRKLS